MRRFYIVIAAAAALSAASVAFATPAAPVITPTDLQLLKAFAGGDSYGIKIMFAYVAWTAYQRIIEQLKHIADSVERNNQLLQSLKQKE